MSSRRARSGGHPSLPISPTLIRASLLEALGCKTYTGPGQTEYIQLGVESAMAPCSVHAPAKAFIGKQPGIDARTASFGRLAEPSQP